MNRNSDGVAQFMEHDTVQLNPATDHSSRPRIGTRVAQWLGSAKLTHSSTARWEAAHEAIALLWEGQDVSPQLWRLYELEPPLLNSLLHPLCNYLLYSLAQTAAGAREGAPAVAAAVAVERLRGLPAERTFTAPKEPIAPL